MGFDRDENVKIFFACLFAEIVMVIAVKVLLERALGW